MVTGGAAGGVLGAQAPGGGINTALSAIGGTLVGGLVGSTIEHTAGDTMAFVEGGWQERKRDELAAEKIRIVRVEDRPERERELAQRLGARYLTRERNEHAKAGNINNALAYANNAYGWFAGPIANGNTPAGANAILMANAIANSGIYGGYQQNVTAGINWYPDNGVAFQFNATHVMSLKSPLNWNQIGRAHV